MKNAFLTFSFFLFVTLCFSQTYITNVTVVDVENQKLISNQTVEISNDIISNIQPSKKTKIPENATVIDGSNKYLAPGLTDAHIHFFQNGGLYSRPDVIDLRKIKSFEEVIEFSHENMEDQLRRYLQNGITNVVDVGATYNLLKLRENFKNDEFAPSVYMTGPLLTTYEPEAYKGLENNSPFSLVKTAEEGRKMVQEQLAYKPDFVKIWYIVQSRTSEFEATAIEYAPIVKAIIDEAHKNNLKVAVHATERITAQLAVENGADFLVHSVDDEIIQDEFVQLLKKNKVVLCPTLTVHNNYYNTFGQKHSFTKIEFETANPYQLGSLLDLKHIKDTVLVENYKNMSNSEISMAGLKKSDSISMVNLKILADAGVLIATGTDAGNIGTLHASSYLKELQVMQKSGLSNWQIIQASTINGAKILNKENEFGTVSIGKKANLILLDNNPINDLENLTKIDKVINNGVIFNPNTLVEETPEALVQRQLNAYNYRNIDAFLEPYAEDVEIYNYPDQLITKGKDNMRIGYSQMFQSVPNLHCELKGRLIRGNIVMDQEYVKYGDKIIDAIAIYHIENNKIKKVYFIN
ncbi:amidohydrolase family protein [Formosa maritima]|uniref:Amidohydrolase family protein n=1 Tax=Formosa maritima TaxID=2592046 RepID=A0A5D0GFJ6_9FLAO|nr:amidohydrolase family protein [Formosa maritima]TYA57500.1 amidohydrolase family protein [Formosa maritima]